MHTVEYRMGRNVKGVPMSDALWAEFVAEAREYLEAAAEFYKAQMADVYGLEGIAWVETHFGRGEWDGVVEESAVVTLYTDTDVAEFAGHLADLDLPNAPTYEDIMFQGEYLAREFEQDAVGVVFGHSTLAEGR